MLAAHQLLLREAFTAHGGHEVDTQGDAFFVAFASARDAVLAAVDGQRSLLAHPWPGGGEVRVRMGIHTGRAAGQDGKYTGLAVHRAARISATGHGGQIVVSHATRILLDDEEEAPGVSLLDLGERRLKDFDQPVRLYQVEAEALPTGFPEVKAPRPQRPVWRRPGLVTAAFVVTAAAALAAFLLIGSGSGGVGPNHVAVIDPETNTVVDSVATGTRPGPVAAGAGSIWVGNLGDRTITRIDAARRRPARTISLAGRTPTGLAYGAGALWVAHGARGQVSRVDPSGKKSTRPIDVADPGSARGSVAVGAGAVWSAFGDSTIGRIDPSTLALEAAFVGLRGHTGIAVVNGAPWVLDAGNRTVRRLNPLSREPAGSPARVGRDPVAITAGDDELWVADRGDDAVTRINVLTGATHPIAVGSRPVAVALGGGAVWVANSGDGTVTRIDPLTETTKTVDVREAPSGIAYASDFVWVALQPR